MKKVFLTLFFGIIAISCSSDSSSGSSLSDTPQAKAIYDNSNYGIYKGVFVGSTGTVLINIMNEGQISATLKIDGSTKTYTTSGIAVEGESTELTFTNGDSSFIFYVNAVGGNVSVDGLNIAGHPNAGIKVIKERSDSLVKCYQGSFSGDTSGTFNFVISGNSLYGLAKENTANYSIQLEGEKSGNSITGYFEGGTFTGTSNGNNISGTWQNDSSESGNWSGNRKL